MLDLLGLILLLLPIVLIVRYFVWRGRYQRINEHLGRLDRRFAAAEAALKQLTAAVQALSPSRPQAAPSAARALGEAEQLAPKAEGAPATVVKPATGGTTRETEIIHAAVPAIAETVAEAEVSAPAIVPTAEHEAVPAKTTPVTQIKAPVWMPPAKRRQPLVGWASASIRSALERAGGGTEWEAVIGGSWLNKIGVVALVIGMALLITFTLQHVGPAGKIALGVGVSAALLGGGVWLEHLEGYALFARPLIGGGWALLYFTAYAAHNFAASRIIADPIAGLGAMLAVAAGMIVHSLRYRSEIVTGIAYVLAFVAIDISAINVYSLLASALLAASLVTFFQRLAWYRLALGAVVATYLTHYLWMYAAAPSGPVSAAAFWTAEGMLALYWLIFAACDFLRAPEDNNQRNILIAITVANVGAFTALSWLLVEGVYPDRNHLLVAAIAAGAIAMSGLTAARGRQLPYSFYGIFGGAVAAVTVALAIINRSLPGELLAIGWAIVASAALVAGLERRHIGFRIESYIIGYGAILAAAAINVINGVSTFVAADSLALRWSTVIIVAAATYCGEWALTRNGQNLDERERLVGEVGGYLATALLAALVFRDVAAPYVGIVWLAGAMIAFELGLAVGYAPLRYRAYALMLASFVALIVYNSNLLVIAKPLTPPLRWMILAAAALAFYTIAWRLKGVKERIFAYEGQFHAVAAHIGALLLALIAWNELPWAAVAVCWALLALLLREAGTRLPDVTLRLDAYALAAAAWTRLFLIDFVSIGAVVGISTRVLTVIPVAALLYYFRHSIVGDAAGGTTAKIEKRLPVLFSAAATVALFALARFEFGRSDAVAAWSVLAIILLAIGVHYRARDYRIQAYLVAIAIFARSWATNFYLTGSFYGVPERIATTIPAIIALFWLGLVWRHRRAELAAVTPGGLWRPIAWVDRHAIQLFCSLGVALTALLVYYSAGGDVLTIAWAVEGLAVTAGGFVLKERALRLSGIGLLAICLAKGLVIDLAGVEPIYRIISFIVLGAILLGISFAYTKYRDFLRTYI